ncbi:MAG: methyl-accepting chemotaxis protein, partial [Treponema sp.]|nr:methyl-accepting chemotaxis protein [Treponema sp.]
NGLFPLVDGITKVFSNNGTIVGHHLYPGNRGSNILDTERDMGGPYMSSLENAVNRGEELQYSHFHPGFQEQMFIFIHPIQIGEAATRWSLAILFPERTVLEPVRAMEITALIIALITTALIIPAIFLITQLLMRPVVKIAGTLKDISEGEGDLTLAIDVNSKDELGSLVHYFNMLLKRLRADFMLFNANAQKMSSVVYDLSTIGKEIGITANEQSASVAEIVSTMESSKELSEQVAAKSIEVSSLAIQTERLSKRGADLHDANESMMADIRGQNAKVVDEIGNLINVLAHINEAVQTIDTIADRTKIIAFNAALEASSAGEAGLRFAVVASEIRRFADNVVESVIEIKQRISDLQNVSGSLISEADVGSKAIDSGYNRMVEQKEVFHSIVEVSQNVTGRSHQISNLSKQQEQASTQIFTVLKEISTGVKHFASGTASAIAIVESIDGISQELKQTLARYHHTNGGAA